MCIFVYTGKKGYNGVFYIGTPSTRGELLSVGLPDGTQVGYIHDPQGRRIAKTINGAIVEKYLWEGLTCLLAVFDGSDTLLMRFEYADDRMPFKMNKNGTTYYLTYDQVGSLRLVTDITGNIVKRLDYDTFGNVLSDSDPAFEVPFGFAGGLYDPDTKLVRFGYRDYDPEVRRWTAKDPIFFGGGDTDLYGYVLNDPINMIDPTGEFGVLITILVAAVEAATTIGGGIALTEVSAITATAAIAATTAAVGTTAYMMSQSSGNFQKMQQGNNKHFKRVFNDAVREIEKQTGKLTDDQIRQLHDRITKQGVDFWDIVGEGLDMFGKPCSW